VKAGAALTADTPCPKADGSSPRTDTFAKEPPTCIVAAKAYTATMNTTAGRIVIALDGSSKKAVNNFVVLARYHYYDGSALFQTIPEIDVVVGGSPKTQSVADPGPGYTITDPPPGTTTDPATGQPKGVFTYTEGVVGVPPTGEEPFAGGAQFFLAGGKNVSQLDAQGVYLVLGRITSGLDIVKRVLASHAPCNPTDTQCAIGGPAPAVTITSVTIQES
jgi:cyclophilin family peptidyl-prolyl cis-trans isomerase